MGRKEEYWQLLRKESLATNQYFRFGVCFGDVNSIKYHLAGVGSGLIAMPQFSLGDGFRYRIYSLGWFKA